MAQLFPQPDHSPGRWPRRLDRAAAAMNPFLTILVIGLAILNLTCLALLAARLPIIRDTPGLAACPPSSEGRPGATAPATGAAPAPTVY